MGISQRTRRRKNRKRTEGIPWEKEPGGSGGRERQRGQVLARGPQHPSRPWYCWSNKARDVGEHAVVSMPPGFFKEGELGWEGRNYEVRGGDS